MSNKWIIGIIVAGVVIGGGLLIFNKSYSPATPVTQSATSTPSTTTSQPNVITLTRDGFSPVTLTIKAGAAVSWVNKSGSDATVNSSPHPVHTNYSPLNLGAFPDGGSLSLTFTKPGTYGYHNHLNPSQSGTIIVQ